MKNAQKVAKFLEAHPKVSWVHYPTLKSSAYYDLANYYFPKGASSIFSFRLVDGSQASKDVCGHTQLFSLLANVGDAKSLIIHPASTTHSQLNERELQLAEIRPESIRLSVGLEHVEDLIDNLTQALKKV